MSDYLSKRLREIETVKDDKPLRYKIYARKSTESSERQIRSIEDQIKDCLALAEHNDLLVVGEPIREEKSAKTANRRDKFNELLKEVKSGKVDGIIAWHPDRLARNMIEAGKIIDMLDRGILKDLKFHSHHFDNSPNGKMMLGMLFVFAKHYSDDLSSKVKRGVRNRAGEGKSGGTPKHGYTQQQGIYKPDTHNNNFSLMQNAWEMRKNGKKLPEIADYLNEHKYSKYYTKDDDWRIMNITPGILSKMFSDPFYYGILIQADSKTDLREMGLGFKPMIDEATYIAVQAIGNSNHKGANKKKQIFLPLRDVMYCDVCHDERPMIVSTPRGKMGKSYVYFTCRNKDCPRHPRNIRAKVIVKAIEPVIKKVIEGLSEASYEAYLQETSALSSATKKRFRSEIVRLQAIVKDLNNKNSVLRESLIKLKDERLIEQTNQEMATNMNEIDRINAKIKEYQQTLDRKENQQRVFSKEEFNELIQNTEKLFQKGKIFQKDVIIRNLFLKLYYDNEKVSNFSLREPFDTLYRDHNPRKISLGGGWEIRTPAPDHSRLTI